MTETELRLNYALTAAGWLGTREGSREHRQILEIYNAIRPLPRGYAMQSTDPWCAAFASAAAVMAGIGALLPLECSCTRIIEKARDMGIWAENDSHVPQPGDWVLYNWQAAITGDDTGAPDHVGVVIGVEGSVISVVEGNYDNAVKLRKLAVDDRTIRGFVCPRFGSRADKEEKMIYHTLEQVPDYARETIRKLIGSGSLRGIAEDDLGLTEELLRTLVILDRLGKL